MREKRGELKGGGVDYDYDFDNDLDYSYSYSYSTAYSTSYLYLGTYVPWLRCPFPSSAQ